MLPEPTDLLSAAPSISDSSERPGNNIQAVRKANPMHTRFPALPPSLPSPWDIHDGLDFLATFKNAFWHGVLIRKLWPASRILGTEVDVCEPGAETSSREIPALLVTDAVRSQENEPGQRFVAAFGGGC